MTTIAASIADGVMVSDSKTRDSDGIKWQTEKIERIAGNLYGAAGDCSEIEKFFRWLRRKGAKPKLTDDFSCLELNKDGLWLWDKKLSPFPPGRDFHAIGSGAMAALAAIQLGCDIHKAVEIACAIDDGSEGPLCSHSLNDSTTAKG